MRELILRFLLVGAIAFGGGQAALPLVERITVADTGWLTPEQFSIGIGLAYATPGPVLILASYVGYRVAGVVGAVLATIAVFSVPVLLAAAAANVVARFGAAKCFRAFGRFAGAAAVGLLGVTLVALVRPVWAIHPAWLIASVVILVAERRGASSILLLALAAVAGATVGGITGY